MAAPRFRWLIRTAVFLLILAVVFIGLILSGVFDPSPFGPRQWQEELLQMSVDPNSRQINWLTFDLPPPPFTIRLKGAYSGGEADSSYGLALGSAGEYFAVAVSPLGYLAIWETTENDSYYLDWQTWPHVRKGIEENEIWLDIEGDLARVRINREWLWEGSFEYEGDKIGILGESFGEEVVVDFESIEMFTGSNE